MHIVDRGFAEISAADLHDILKLRVDVFVVEQDCAYPELDGRDNDPATRHVWVEGDDEPRAYLRVLDDGDARRIGRVATRDDARSGGLARALVSEVLDTSTGPWVLDAQTYLVGWYRDLGFTDDGDEFVEDGIPHIPMRRDIP